MAEEPSPSGVAAAEVAAPEAVPAADAGAMVIGSSSCSSAGGGGGDSDDDDDDDSFKSASCSLAESMMECSTSPLFRSAHSTLDAVGGGSVSGSSGLWRGSVHAAAGGGERSGGGGNGGDGSTENCETDGDGDGNGEEGRAAEAAATGSCSGDCHESTTPAEPPTIQRFSRPAHSPAAGDASRSQSSGAGLSAAAGGTDSQKGANANKPGGAAAADAADVSESDTDTGPWRLITSRTETERPTINSVTINQDVTCVAVGTSKGFRIRTVVPPPDDCDAIAGGDGDSGGDGSKSSRPSSDDQQPRVMVHQSAIPHGGVTFCQMLYGTSLLAVVRASAPRVLCMTNAWTGTSLRDLHFVTPVKRVEMNRGVVAVLTADGRLHVFTLATLHVVKSVSVVHPSEPLRSITGTNAGTSGAYFALSTVEDEPWLACRSPEAPGDVKVYGAADMGAVGTVSRAHSHPIARVAIGGRKGEQRLATASSKGTVIRVWSLPQCSKLYVLLRGSSPCTTYSVAFNDAATRLGSSSSTGTVHIFKLSSVGHGDNGAGAGSYGQMVRNGLVARLSVPRLSFFLPESVSDQTDGLRSYAKIRTKPARVGVGGASSSSVPTSVVAFLKQSNRFEDDVLVITETGSLYRFSVDAKGHSQTVAVEDLLFDDENVVYNSL